MKRFVWFFLLLIVVPFNLSPAQEKGDICVTPLVGYGYNYSYGSTVNLAAMIDWYAAGNFSITGGLQANTGSIYSALVKGKVEFCLSKGILFIENRYLYNTFYNDNTQEFVSGLSLGYNNRHWKFQLGYSNRFFTQITRVNGDIRSYIVEPVNILYNIEGHLFDSNHPWNIGARLSNIDYFTIERFSSPMVMLLSHCKLTSSTSLFLDTGLRPAGNYNLSSNFWGCFIRIGTHIIW